MLRAPAETSIMYFKVSVPKGCLGVPVHGKGHFPFHHQHCLQSAHSSQSISCSSHSSQHFGNQQKESMVQPQATCLFCLAY